MRQNIIFFIALILTSLSFASETRLWAPYNEFYEEYEKFYLLPESERSLVDLKLRVSVTDKSYNVGDIDFLILNSVERESFGLDEWHNLNFPLRKKFKESNPNILVNVPADTKIILTLAATYKGSTKNMISSDSLVNFIKQFRQVINNQYGFMSFFISKPKGISIRAANSKDEIFIHKVDGSKERVNFSNGGKETVFRMDYLTKEISAIKVSNGVVINAFFENETKFTSDVDG